MDLDLIDIHKLEKRIEELESSNQQNLDKIVELLDKLAYEKRCISKLMQRTLWERIINKYTII